MPRGRGKAIYVSDRGPSFWLYVDLDSMADVNRGWIPLGNQGFAPFPEYWSPRYVFGVDALGNSHRTRIATTAAPLWTGTVTTWSIEASDRTLVQVTKIGQVGERSSR
jgi:hypothetical protein